MRFTILAALPAPSVVLLFFPTLFLYFSLIFFPFFFLFFPYPLLSPHYYNTPAPPRDAALLKKNI